MKLRLSLAVAFAALFAGSAHAQTELKFGHVGEPASLIGASSEADIFGVFEMPYLVKNREHMKKIEKELFWSKMAPESEKKGVKLIAVWENGYRHITNNRHPINTPADLK